MPARAPAPRPLTEPTVLVIGADDTFLPALRLALARHQVYVESSLPKDAVETVIVTAPDLVLLVGEATRDSGRDILKALSASPVSSIVPVALLSDDTGLEGRLSAFRHGAAAVIPRSASVDAIAEQVAKVAREIPDRGAALGVIGEATLSEFVNTLHKELRSGILSVQKADGDTPVRLVLGGGRPLAAFIDDFVRRVRRHVVHAEPLNYEFDDRAAGTVQLLANESLDSEPPPGNIEGLRVLLADSDPVRVDVVAQELRARGATVVVSDFSPDHAHFARLRQIDPQVLMIGEAELEGAGYELVKRLKRDTRLRWASLLVVRWSELWANALAVPSIDRIRGALAELSEPDRGLRDRAELGDAFDARLEVTGPSRCLRALTASKRAFRVSVHNTRVSIDVDLSDGLVVGATARTKQGEHWEGARALSAFLVLGSGRVHVEPVAQPATTNIMTTIDVALDLAEGEPPPLLPSLMPASADGVPERAAPLPPVPAPPPSAPVAPILAVLPPPAAIGAPPPPQRAPSPFRTQVLPAMVLPTAPETPPSTEPAPAEPTPASRTSAEPMPASQTPSGVSQPLVPHAARPGSFLRRFTGRGVSRPVTALLIGLAVLQGLIVAVGLAMFFDRKKGAPDSGAASTEATTESSRAAQETSPATSTPATEQPTPTPPTPSAPVASAPPVVPVPTSTTIEETLVQTKSCDELTAQAPKQESFPGAAFEQLKLARKALVRGDADEAQRAYCTAVRWDPKNSGHYFELAQLLLLRKDGAAAAQWAKEGVALEPTSARGQSLLGDALARLADHEGAKRAWFAAARISDPTPEQVSDLSKRSIQEAEQALIRRDVARAERFFRRAVILEPENVTAATGLATALLRLGEMQPALSWAERANALQPKDAKALVLLGDIAAAAGDPARARERYAAAAELGHPDAAARMKRLK